MAAPFRTYCFIICGMGVLVYFVLVYLFRVEEVDWVIKAVRDRLGKVVARV